jgi:hypothetical protein
MVGAMVVATAEKDWGAGEEDLAMGVEAAAGKVEAALAADLEAAGLAEGSVEAGSVECRDNGSRCR